MRKLFNASLLIVFSLVCNSVFAQQDWRWETHGVGFNAPANLHITANNEQEFTAEANDLVLSIYVEENGEVTEEALAEALVAAAREMEYDNISAVAELEIHDFKGYLVEGTRDGIGALIITLLDTQSSTNLVVVLAYSSNAARTKAIEIGDSFYAFD